jgi:hypothetical protein
MDEMKDIMGLAMMVGGEINNLKKSTVGDGKFIHKGLEDPATFVKNVAMHDIKPLINQNKNTSLPPEQINNELPVKPQNIVGSIIPLSNSPQLISSNDALINVLSEIKDELFEIKNIMKNKYENKYS